MCFFSKIGSNSMRALDRSNARPKSNAQRSSKTEKKNIVASELLPVVFYFGFFIMGKYEHTVRNVNIFILILYLYKVYDSIAYIVVFLKTLPGYTWPSKHEKLTQCCFNVGPSFAKLAQHWNNTGSMSGVYCSITVIDALPVIMVWYIS